MTNQSFNVEEWLNSKKKGFGSKVPRADFIAKIKELIEEIENSAKQIEQLKQEKTQLVTKNKDLEEKLTISQTDLNSRDQTIQGKDKEINNLNTNLSNLNNKLGEQEEKLKNLQQRPNITNEKYQELQSNLSDLQSKSDELLNNQEKHKEEDLKPTNLPTDWEQQLSDKKTAEEKLVEIENKLTELEKRPTQTDLNNAIQQERAKYKDYDDIKADLLEVKSKYDKLKGANINEEELKTLNQQLQVEREKNKVLEEELTNLSPPIVQEGEIIKKVGEIVNSAINSLKQEIIELLKKQPLNNNSSNNSPSELPTDYKEVKASKEKLLRILGTLNSKL